MSSSDAVRGSRAQAGHQKDGKDATGLEARRASPSKLARAPRVYLANGYRRRAAGVPYRLTAAEGVQVLLISSRKHPDNWILPGGSIDPGEDAATAAVRETLEEAGISGAVVKDLGTSDNPEKKTYTSFYALLTDGECSPVWEESERRRQWVPLDEALKRLEWRPYDHPALTAFAKIPREELNGPEEGKTRVNGDKV